MITNYTIFYSEFYVKLIEETIREIKDTNDND